MTADTAAREAADRVRAWIVALREATGQDHFEVRYFAGSECRCGEVLPCPTLAALNQNIAALEVVLDEREPLAARVAELEAERDADVRAVAAVVRARAGYEEGRAISNLAGRFNGRIAELDMRAPAPSESETA